VAIGANSLIKNTVGSYNIAIGTNALPNLEATTATGNNIAIGSNAGGGIKTGVNNVIIGGVGSLTDNLSNTVIIGTGDGVERVRFDATGEMKIATINTATTTTSVLVEESGVVKKVDINDLIEGETKPTIPTNLSVSESGDHTILNWDGVATNDYYEVWMSMTSSTAGFSLVGKVMKDVITSTITFADTSYNKKTTIYYKVYAYNNGKVSDPATANVTLLNNVPDVAGLQVVKLAHALFINWENPDDRRLEATKIEVDFDAVEANLSQSAASTIYEGKRASAFYQIADADKDKFYKVWATTITRT
jgi:hypothetical protein